MDNQPTTSNHDTQRSDAAFSWEQVVSANFTPLTGAVARPGDITRAAAMLTTVLNDLVEARRRAGNTFDRDEGAFDQLLMEYRHASQERL
ncbi:MAG: hypothetical protein EA345_07000 [Halomonas sp.]|nr:hypothetical protein [Halomonas sp.]TVP49405.1 MAG: hypothetical protein EA345_07000 [Halomonas sp.]